MENKELFAVATKIAFSQIEKGHRNKNDLANLIQEIYEVLEESQFSDNFGDRLNKNQARGDNKLTSNKAHSTPSSGEIDSFRVLKNEYLNKIEDKIKNLRNELGGTIADLEKYSSELKNEHLGNLEFQGSYNKPAVEVDNSVHEDYIICLEDGAKRQSLKRYLKVKYGMSSEEYRKKWNLPADYPMIAPSYRKKRSAIAKKTGFADIKKSSGK